MKDNIKIEVTAESGSTLTILEGSAPPYVAPKKVALSGNVDAPRIWFLDRKEVINAKAANLKVDVAQTDVVIKFREDEKDEFGTHITGNLKPAEELSAFGINQDKLYSPNDLAKFLRKNRWLIATDDLKMFDDAISKLSAFKAKVEREIEQNRDDKGNKKSLDETKLSAELPLFILSCPIFSGEIPQRFTVEIGANVTTEVRLFLYSDELHHIIGRTRGEIIAREIAPFKEAGIPVIVNG